MCCRVPCEYEHRNLSVRVEERSRAPNELAVRFLYQGGQTDIVAVDVAQVKKKSKQFTPTLLPLRRVMVPLLNFYSSGYG
jgi:hypothetical protein